MHFIEQKHIFVMDQQLNWCGSVHFWNCTFGVDWIVVCILCGILFHNLSQNPCDLSSLQLSNKKLNAAQMVSSLFSVCHWNKAALLDVIQKTHRWTRYVFAFRVQHNDGRPHYRKFRVYFINLSHSMHNFKQ